jgi:hypothetical protein
MSGDPIQGHPCLPRRVSADTLSPSAACATDGHCATAPRDEADGIPGNRSRGDGPLAERLSLLFARIPSRSVRDVPQVMPTLSWRFGPVKTRWPDSCGARPASRASSCPSPKSHPADQAVDPSALIRRQSPSHHRHAAPPAPTLSVPLRQPPPARSRKPRLAPAARRVPEDGAPAPPPLRRGDRLVWVWAVPGCGLGLSVKRPMIWMRTTRLGAVILSRTLREKPNGLRRVP